MINLFTISHKTSKNSIILLTVLILYLVSSFKTIDTDRKLSGNDTLFSIESQRILKNFIMENISYPYEAKNKNITGKLFIVIKTQKGGKISNINVIGKDERITIPLVFNEILIIDKPTSSNRVGGNTSEYVTRPIAVLENEAIRVIKMFESLNLPEWQSKKMEFAISFNFKLTD